MKTARTFIAVALLAGFLRGLGMQHQQATPTPTPVPSPSPTPNEPAQQPKKIRVSSGVVERMIRHRVEPVYPWDARVNHITGDVVLQATIDRQGNITNLRAVKGDPILVKSAVKAVSQWKYHPYVLNGEVVEVETTVLIKYHM